MMTLDDMTTNGDDCDGHDDDDGSRIYGNKW